MKLGPPRLIFILGALLFNSNIVFSQIDWRINSELGLYRSSGYGILKEKDLLTRIDAFLKYKYEEEKRNASLSLRIRPEFYGLKNPFNSIKIKADGDYFQLEENFNWGFSISRQRNFFNDNILDLTYDVFALIGSTTLFYFEGLPLSTSAGYAYQLISGEEEYNLDLLFIDIKLFKPVNDNLNMGFGFYLEKFFIENEIIIQGIREKNKNYGFRIGPQASVNYLKEIIINIDYRLLIHESDYTSNFSNEHWIRLVAGKIFFNNWSAFLLIDYNSFLFKKTGNYVEGITPLYTPLNLENRIYLKIAYEISSHFEIFTKGGYFKDNLYEDKFSLEGWNAVLGIELSSGR